MIKFIVKTVIVLLALQSAMDYLRREEIIEGSLEVNYPIIQQKLLAAVSMKKIAAGLSEFAVDKIQDRVDKAHQRAFWEHDDPVKEKSPYFKIIVHVVDRGDTLNELSQRYGVHWRVIQRVNHLGDAHKLMVGQRLKIPSRMHQLI